MYYYEGIRRLVIGFVCAFGSTAFARTVDLSRTPPEVTQAVAPNLVITFDDSGSMAFDYMPDQMPYKSSAWANPYKCASVIDPREQIAGELRATSMNGVYFNPNNDYAPPLDKQGRPFADASFANAWDDGIVANRPSAPETGMRRNLASLGFCGKTGAGYFRLKSGIALGGASGIPDAASIGRIYTAANWEWISLADADAGTKRNFANWYAYYRTRRLAAISSVSRAFTPFADNVRVAWQNINVNLLGPGTNIFPFVDSAATKQVRTRFYDWLFAIPASGGTPNRSAAIRVGEFFRRTGADDRNPYWDTGLARELSCRQNFHIQMTDGLWNQDAAVSIPTRDSTSRPLPDTRRFSAGEAESSVIWNEDTTSTVTMADIAFHYWATDLRPDFRANPRTSLRVPTRLADLSTSLFGKPLKPGEDPRDNAEIYWNPGNDPASWPHLVQFMIGFGAPGTLAVNDDVGGRLRRGNLRWPAPVPTTDDGRKIDDIWHAALNSRGRFFAASNPAQLVAALTDIIAGIVASSTAATGVAVSGTVLHEGLLAYRTGYDSGDWSGSLEALDVDAAGKLGNLVWSAAPKLDQRSMDSRVIFTSDAQGAGRPFRWADIGDALRDVDPAFEPGLLDYLRGERRDEGERYRQRRGLLGAVVNSQAVYVGRPSAPYNDTFPPMGGVVAPESELKDGIRTYSYRRFVADHRLRAPTIYVGANDGMLHAFDATAPTIPRDEVDVPPDPGAERWAYVPRAIWNKLPGLARDFAFDPNVDGTPVVRDVFFASGTHKGWHSLLVAGLRYGGRGIYALDVTDAAATEGDAQARVLWEFDATTADGGELGYTFGQPAVARLAHGRWAVLLPGGYFPHGDTDPAAKRTTASLYILDAQTGELIRELKTPEGLVGYGMGSPVLGDYNGDQIDDVAFAGDLAGNLWRFDLGNPNPANWSVSSAFRPKVVGERSVTTMPRLFPDPHSGGFTVVFGTGRYLGSSDVDPRTGTVRQALYGIREIRTRSNPVVEGDASLVQQLMIERDGLRALTRRPVPVAASGWFVELNPDDGSGPANRGERVVVTPRAESATNRVVFVTLVPGTGDPCNPSSTGALIVLDAATGGPASGESFGDHPPWGDGFETAGAIVVNPPTGGSLPAVSSPGGGDLLILGVHREGGEPLSVPDLLWRRRAWRELGHDD
jgi:type IV pilus assembly protein PilY1